MAESTEEVLDKALLPVKNDNASNIECAVCLQTCIHPAELPCGHIFCYLCIKGIVNQGRRCAMCRRDIPVDYLDKPILLSPVDADVSSQGFEDGHLWFYEGHNGWWQYDERTSLELESAYQKGERCCELLIAGFLYVADFDEMLQYRRNDPSRRRRIKRDLATTNKKGVAGLKTMKFNNPVWSNSTAAASNELTVTWSISNTPVTTNSSPVRIHIPVISNELTEPVSNCQRSRERILSGLSHSACSSTPPVELSSHADTSDAYSRNFNFDNITQETLDLTIEQIESLNLELLNDYEVLFRDVNYGQLQDSLHQNRSERVVENYLTRYLNRSNPRAEPLENQSETTYIALSDLSESSDENSGSELPAIAQETLTTNETESVMPHDADTPPQPPPRGTSRRRNFLRNSLNLAHEICTPKFS